MKKTFLVIVLISICFSCSKKQEKPKWLLSKDQMIGFLIDLHLAESKISKLGVKRDSSAILFKGYEKKLFEKHNIVDTLYHKSYNYYLGDLKVMNEMYAAIVDSLNFQEQLIKQNQSTK